MPFIINCLWWDESEEGRTIAQYRNLIAVLHLVDILCEHTYRITFRLPSYLNNCVNIYFVHIKGKGKLEMMKQRVDIDQGSGDPA